MKYGIGLYGNNQHQVHAQLVGNSRVRLCGICEFDKNLLDPSLCKANALVEYKSLEDMLGNGDIGIISLCSPMRSEQAKQAIMCMEKGKHVLAEKPCAFSEEEIDELLETSKRTGMVFREMAGAGLSQPVLGIGKVIDSGILGNIVQVFCQKSYPMHERRPNDEMIDGGIIMQCALHAIRYIEHGSRLRINNVKYAIETQYCNQLVGGDLKTACSIICTLENGGIATIIANYWNPLKGFGKWGNEHMRVFGENGFAEFTDSGERTRVVLNDKDMGAYDAFEDKKPYFEYFIDEVQGVGGPPMKIQDEIHATRIAIRAKKIAELY